MDAHPNPVPTAPTGSSADRGPSWPRWKRAAVEFVNWTRTLASAGIYALLIVTFVGQIARVDGSSMEPTLDDQDRLVVNKLGYFWSKPQVGDIVMVAAPDQPEKLLVKRIVAGPGDIVRSETGRLYLNDVPVSDDFIPTDFRSIDDWMTVVPPAHYFVLGDHRNNSLDSRAFGPVPQGYIKGKVQLRWWPVDRGRLF